MNAQELQTFVCGLIDYKENNLDVTFESLDLDSLDLVELVMDIETELNALDLFDIDKLYTESVNTTISKFLENLEKELCHTPQL